MVYSRDSMPSIEGRERAMDEGQMRDYAAILVDTCLGFRSGDKLRIGGEHPHRELMLAIARHAYERGAREVRIEYADKRLSRIEASAKRRDFLDAAPAAVERMGALYAEEGWCYLSLVGDEDPAQMEGVDPDCLQILGSARARSLKGLHTAILSNRLAWCVAPAPTKGWADTIFAEARRAPARDSAEALWRELVPILRLDSTDPAQAVAAHMRALEARARALDALSLREIRFLGPGTDLRIPLAPEARWIGGGSSTPDGRRFFPNVPTEEVFTSPDWRGVEGRATCTRPVKLFGQTVRGAWLEFRSGELVACGADANAEALERYAQTDPGAKRLGEVALVDGTGPIFKSGLVFDNSLIDENAACHIALGSAYEESWAGIESVEEEARSALGFNVSMVHEDLMLGCDAVEAIGRDASGAEIPILRGGRFLV